MSSFPAYFYKLKKRTNSTERPGASAKLHTLNVTLKAGSSIVNPTIEIGHGATFENVVDVNYCHIPKFNRYYYVVDTVYDRGIWYLTLNVDALASYRDEIGADTRYILRASAESDGTITDMMYPTKCKTSYQTATKSIWAKTLAGGCYVVTTLSTKGEGIGAAKIWAFTPEQFDKLVDVLFGENAVDLGDFVVNSALVNKLINPGQYITKCTWYPFPTSAIDGLTLQNGLFVGYKALPVPCYSINSSFWEWFGTLSLEENKHPQINRGAYMARHPFSKYQLFVPPFGVVPYDVVGASYASAALTISVELVTGVGKLYAITPDGEQHIMTTNIGIDVPLAHLETEFHSKVGTLTAQIGATVTSAISGNVAGVVAGGFSAIGSAWDSWENVNLLGSLGGNLNAYTDSARLTALYIWATDDDNARNGRPLCARRTISEIAGYIQCGDGYTKISGTANEYNEVNRIMKEGFYYV